MSSRHLTAVFLLVLMAVPACGRAKAPQAAGDANGSREYLISFGDTLSEISDRFDVPGGYMALAELNEVHPDAIGGGRHLKVPPTREAIRVLPPILAPQRQQPPFSGCDAQVLSPPTSRQIAGCAAAACVEGPDQLQVCACEGDELAQGIHVFRNSKPQIEWSVPFSPHSGDEWERSGTIMDFEVVAVQLDSDPELELAVASLLHWNDVGMSQWNLALIDGTRARSAVRMQVANYGEGTFVGGRSGTCDVLSTSWEVDRSPDEEWYGNYLMARQMRWMDGELVAVKGQPLWARRLLYSFQPSSAQRPGGLNVGGPAFDFAHPKTEARAVEPNLRRVKVRDIDVVIRSSRPAERTEDGALHLLTEQGTLLAGHGHQFYRLGHRDSGRLYPADYVPAVSLINRKATITEYQGYFEGQLYRVLWL